jgi:hypothetical protein
MVMVQLPSSTAQFTGWGPLLLQLLTLSYNVSSVIPTNGVPTVQQGIPANVPLQCLTGKVPSAPIASTCVCAPGYETAGQQCSPCAVNRFKPAGGPGACAPCPVGLTTAGQGSSTCSSPSPASAAAADSNNMTVILAAAVGGGILGLLLLLFLLQSILAPGAKNSP